MDDQLKAAGDNQDLLYERTFTRALLDTLNEGVIACDTGGKVVMYNERLKEWHGTDASDPPPDPAAWLSQLYADDGVTPLDPEAAPLLRALRGEAFQGAEMVLRVEGREPRHLLANGSPIYDRERRQLGAVAVVHDVTRQKRVDEAMRKISVAMLQSPVAIVITNVQGNIEFVNPKFTQMTGYSALEVLGRNPRIFKTGHLPPSAYERLWATILAGETWHGEFLNRRKNGELYWEAATIAPIKTSNGRTTHFVAIKEDVTELKQAGQARLESETRFRQLNAELEERIRRRTALLEEANEELDAFSYSVSHDLRAPLRGIDGFSQALVEECAGQLSAEGLHYLERVRSSTRRMGQLIDDLLKLSRVSRGELNRRPLDLSAVARSLMEELHRRDPARPLEFQVEEGLAAVGDPGLVHSALENLLDNAWKYTAKVPLARIAFLREFLADGSCAFVVRDNGAGFDMEYAGKLFTAFQRLHAPSDFEGSGIGLAIVQRIIHRHGGRVWARAAAGQGASFHFTLPEQP